MRMGGQPTKKTHFRKTSGSHWNIRPTTSMNVVREFCRKHGSVRLTSTIESIFEFTGETMSH